MKNTSIMLFLFASFLSTAQQQFCNPIPFNGANVTTPIAFSATNVPANDKKYYTAGAITSSGTISLTDNRIFAGTSISFTNGFKATPATNFIAAVGPCTTVSSRRIKSDSEADSAIIAENLISIYPNPTTNEINIRWDNYNVSQIGMYSLDGKKIHEKEINSTDTKTCQFNTTALANGNYYIKLDQKEGASITKRFIKK